MDNDTIDTIAWLVGLAVFVAGICIQWGWPAAMVAFGAIFTFWPLVKVVVKRR